MAAACFVALLTPAAAFAQAQVGGTKPHNPTLPAVLVIFCIALGLIIIARSANRSPDVKLEPLDED